MALTPVVLLHLAHGHEVGASDTGQRALALLCARVHQEVEPLPRPCVPAGHGTMMTAEP